MRIKQKITTYMREQLKLYDDYALENESMREIIRERSEQDRLLQDIEQEIEENPESSLNTTKV
jgi:hypothetical protein